MTDAHLWNKAEIFDSKLNPCSSVASTKNISSSKALKVLIPRRTVLNRFLDLRTKNKTKLHKKIESHTRGAASSLNSCRKFLKSSAVILEAEKSTRMRPATSWMPEK